MSESNRTYKVTVRSVTGATLTFNNVKELDRSDSNVISFKDNVTGNRRIFPAGNCEIEVVG